MNSNQKDVEGEQWLSTYGLITIERILGRYQIRLSPDKLSSVIKNPNSFYNIILQIPLKLVLTGIVLQQAFDYYVYAQKLHIDYLLSSDSVIQEESPGEYTRESLEEERLKLQTFGEDFQQLKITQNVLIAHTQAALIELAKLWKTQLNKAIHSMHKYLRNAGFDTHIALVTVALEHALIHSDLKTTQINSQRYLFIDKLNELLKISITHEVKENILNELSSLIQFSINLEEELSDFSAQTKELNESARYYRNLMHDAILTAVELLKLLPEYKINQEQDLINKEILYFDKTLGGS
ncbi:MAG: hypothetical protein H0U75_02625 [Legionella sp.]|nr:hypothetical protein [Legionella sp.]